MSTTVRVTPESRDVLKKLANEAGKPMQEVFNRALFLYQRELKRKKRRREIELFAIEHAGSEWDHDPELAAMNEERLRKL